MTDLSDPIENEPGDNVMTDPIRILCVDDELNILKAIERTFLDDDYEILTATSGEEGLRMMAESGEIRLVISDYRMPGMNGVEFLREVCRRWPDTVRIVLSGFADTAAVISAINEGQIYQFIPKPWDVEEFRASVVNAVALYESRKVPAPPVETIRPPIRYRDMIEAMPFPVLCADADGLLAYANGRALALSGGGWEAIAGAKASDLLPGLPESGEGKARVAFFGRPRKAEAIPLSDAEGTRVGTLVVLGENDE